MAKNPTFTDANTLQLRSRAAKFQNKVLGLHRGEGGIEGDNQRVLDALSLHQPQLEVEGRQEAGGAFRAQNGSGVGIKGQNDGNAADARGGIQRGL